MTKAELAKDGVDVRVVSMPSMEAFEEQTAEYKESVLPKACRKRVAVEALSDFGWYRYVGLDGKGTNKADIAITKRFILPIPFIC